MTFEEMKAAFLVGALRHLNEKGSEQFIPSSIEIDGIKLNAGQLRVVVGRLSGESCIDYVGERNKESVYELNWRGIQEAEKVAAQRSPQTQVPASDRYVSLSDNERDALVPELRELTQVVRGSNESAEEDRLIALSEIAAFEATIIQSRISSELIDRFAKSILRWITDTFSAAAVKTVAGRIIEILLKAIA